ncbi:MAG TPA: aminopeptidase P N-terminal domain-containing protein [Longimicrobiales bacterium]|nr:aminopeptidase P N-terminal domain-containing protein [Longimicrobiales bacterium]
MSLPDVPAEVFARRRTRVLAALGPRAALVLSAGPELRAGDAELRYPVDPDLYYLTGYTEPEAVLVLSPAADAPFTLFVRPRDPERELWTGVRGGADAARVEFGADAAHAIAELPAGLRPILESVDHLYYRAGTGRGDVDRLLRELVAAARVRRPRHGVGVHTVSDPGLLLDELRLVKDEREIAALREAARITVESFREAQTLVRPGAGEWELEAALEGGFRRRGASGPAFPSIVAGGPGATVLHYVSNARALNAGELVLVDAGARAGMYCADMTRTWPVDGRFTDAQRTLYDVVRGAHAAALAQAVPGRSVDDVHHAAVHALSDGMVALGLLRGDAAELATEPARYRRFYPHRTSHWLGLDTHDVGDYVRDGAGRVLEPGMVLTIEPGLYVPAADPDAPAALRGTGIRLEDDVLITANGHEVLTADLPL